MSIEVTEIKNVFMYKGKKISIPGNVSEREALKIASGTYPELINGSVNYNGVVDGNKQFEFTSTAGTKG